MNEDILFESKIEKPISKTEYPQLQEEILYEINEEILEKNENMFNDSFFNSPLVFDEFPATKILLTFFSVSFTSLGVIDFILGFSRLGLMSFIISLFILFFRFGERNRQHSSIFVLSILTFVSILTWKVISKYIVDNNDDFESKIYPFLILQFSATLFLSLWLLLISLSGYSSKNNQYFNIEQQKYRADANLFFSPISAINWYLITMGFEFSIFTLFLLQGSYIIAIIPFSSLLISYFYILSKSRQVLQYTEVLLPFVMLSYVILRMLYIWAAPTDFISLLGALLIISMVVKQVIGLSILFIPIINYSDIINNSGSYNVIVIVAYKSFVKNKNIGQDKNANDQSPNGKDDESSIISDKSETDNSYHNGIIAHQNTFNDVDNMHTLINTQGHEDIELNDQPSHSIVIDDNPEANIPYEDGNSRLVLNIN